MLTEANRILKPIEQKKYKSQRGRTERLRAWKITANKSGVWHNDLAKTFWNFNGKLSSTLSLRFCFTTRNVSTNSMHTKKMYHRNKHDSNVISNWLQNQKVGLSRKSLKIEKTKCVTNDILIHYDRCVLLLQIFKSSDKNLLELIKIIFCFRARANNFLLTVITRITFCERQTLMLHGRVKFENRNLNDVLNQMVVKRETFESFCEFLQRCSAFRE